MTIHAYYLCAMRSVAGATRDFSHLCGRGCQTTWCRKDVLFGDVDVGTGITPRVVIAATCCF